MSNPRILTNVIWRLTDPDMEFVGFYHGNIFVQETTNDFINRLSQIRINWVPGLSNPNRLLLALFNGIDNSYDTLVFNKSDLQTALDVIGLTT